MREILFRGKRIDNGEWVYGDLVRNYFKIGDSCICVQSELAFYSVEPETVGQFTGLIDKKNSKRIFEGDIIRAHYANAPKSDFVEQVVFHEGRFCSLFCTPDGRGMMWEALPFSAQHVKSDQSIYMEWCEVIGNIHDNPELLSQLRRKDGRRE